MLLHEKMENAYLKYLFKLLRSFQIMRRTISLICRILGTKCISFIILTRQRMSSFRRMLPFMDYNPRDKNANNVNRRNCDGGLTKLKNFRSGNQFIEMGVYNFIELKSYNNCVLCFDAGKVLGILTDKSIIKMFPNVRAKDQYI